MAVEAKRPVTKPDFTLYHTAETLWDEVGAIISRRPEYMEANQTIFVVPDMSYNSTLRIVTVEPGGLTATHTDKLRILVNFGQHARELVTSEIALGLLRVLADPARELLTLLERRRVGSPIPMLELLAKSVWKVIPLENSRGRAVVEAGRFCERRNGRGVDTNRNWGVDWGKKEPDYDPNEEFPGTKAFSEPEANLVREAAVLFQPHIWINVHSGMEALFMPFDHKVGAPGGGGAAASNATLAMLAGVNKEVFGGRCVVGPGGKSVGYLAHGTATDYMHGILKVPVSLTWEVFGDESAAYEDCYRMFNPTTREGLEAVVDSWTAAFFALLSRVPDHMGMPRQFWSPQLAALGTRREGLGLTRPAVLGSWGLAPWMGASLAVVAFFVVLFRRRGRSRATHAAQ
ncbi:CGL90 [Auxenochlorella protothecoides x Auxenochlorella symbiontica]